MRWPSMRVHKTSYTRPVIPERKKQKWIQGIPALPVHCP
jgi:hypothetical protein